MHEYGGMVGSGDPGLKAQLELTAAYINQL